VGLAVINGGKMKNKKEKSRKEEFIKILESELCSRVVDICDEYRGKNFIDGVSVFLGCPGSIIEATRERLKKL